ncbi:MULTISPECIES: thioredoxin family protein [Jeotgalicoccus]|uniref:thioredoxin family protein n=1 Tax=Jeotgalicoccus TaxID=227979 RepID=UPI00041B5284|nr:MULTISPECIES: thioredoxin family protein [Jeotgalicoccus]QQD85966.1 thioredoxin family protein [Jeotgalicoccus sp. ATCC 8456]
MVNLKAYYDSGLTMDAYRQTLSDLKTGFDKIYNEHEVQQDSDFERLKERGRKLLVIAEPWCAHCMLNLAILFKLSEAAETDVRVVLRDENLELMDEYLTNGNRVIPKVIALNNSNEEVAVWGPKAPMTDLIQKDLMKDMPEKNTPEYKAAFEGVKKEMREKFSTSPVLWQAVETDLKQVLSS